MIDPIPSVGWFIEDESDVEYVHNMTLSWGVNVHLSFYSLESIKTLAQFVDCADFINSIHLPNGLTVKDFERGGVVHMAHTMLGVNLFNIHPWNPDLQSIVEEVIDQNEYELCLETFKLRTDKIGNPMRQLAQYGRYMLESDMIGLTVDLTHIEPEVCNYTFVRSLLPFTKIIHMSETIDGKKHQPIFTGPTGNSNVRNIVGMCLDIPQLPVREFVLEYDREFRGKLFKHHQWLKNLIFEKRRRVNARKV